MPGDHFIEIHECLEGFFHPKIAHKVLTRALKSSTQTIPFAFRTGEGVSEDGTDACLSFQSRP